MSTKAAVAAAVQAAGSARHARPRTRPGKKCGYRESNSSYKSALRILLFRLRRHNLACYLLHYTHVDEGGAENFSSSGDTRDHARTATTVKWAVFRGACARNTVHAKPSRDARRSGGGRHLRPCCRVQHPVRLPGCFVTARRRCSAPRPSPPPSLAGGGCPALPSRSLRRPTG